ncbi:hypothetical protein RYX36_007292 [Vicia faba]
MRFLPVESIKSGVEEFFNLPMEEKNKFWQTPEEMQGFGQLYVALEEEKLRWGDMFFVKTFPLHRRNPYLNPYIPQPFSNEDGLLPSMSPTEQVIGLNPHSDVTAITILLEVNQVQGLQIKKDGMWIPINPLSNAFLVNVGDALEVLTNGIYKSIEHRVTVNSMKERISLAAFHNPRMSGHVGPIPSLVTLETPALFKTISTEDFVKKFLSSKINGKYYLDGLKI